MAPRVLVAYASRYGGVREIAEVVADALRARGLEVDVYPADEVTRVRPYDAVVLGSGVYFGAWLPEATELLESFQSELAQKPVWLFSSGSTEAGTEASAADTAPPEPLAPLVALIQPRGVRRFAGRVEGEKLSLDDWLVNPALRSASADLRDWDAIRAWGAEIAAALLARQQER
ncbi:flavodoxin domain-containing protein [Truepera radiovictrix]|uniref:Flavodoxin/nitric oxide synthase n=1 Tax=Truepera radiovictrix (strain DSM 17093 / CIP 108686 / LMG 22925 / RQ-24) TaxID=649638 RepID=D7CQD2_TRURR|nr:flavodoxin domain-containing protein [Truepera radiovictrix]ADI14916.1 flavodoxin/nitric oxide synthase [Truepera radiovictrix DSM 17093]WMT56533.1 flavodoxin domain-containing protein [Truepera radiovictrix]